ncbi:MAG: chemotaxis protein CheB [Calditrichaeota bacterium]|nr:chemotaxis protein CheB [Calditrichota bacterium]
MKHQSDFEAIVLGVSTGGTKALRMIIPNLPSTFPLPIVIVQHLHPHSDSYFVEDFRQCSNLIVEQAEEKVGILPGHVYIAPSNYHLLLECERTLSLSVDEPVNFARPSIDVLFDTAAEVFREKLIGIILTGAGKDGSAGVRKIKKNGGFVIVQNLDSAQVETMPRAAMNAIDVDLVIPLEEMVPTLLRLTGML